MNSAVDNTAPVDDSDDSKSNNNLFKRRRSSTLVSNEQSPSKRVRSDSTNELQSMFTCLNEIVDAHRNLVQEYIDLQKSDQNELSIDEENFIKAEQNLIEKVEQHIQEINSSWLSKESNKPITIDRFQHENQVLKRVEELKKKGRWSNQRLPKIVEPKKRKTHWDYLLDEMRWLAEDFAHEKRWKSMMSKKISLAILRYFREKNQAENQQQRDEQKRLKKHALFVCKEVMNFWKNMHKIAEFKETTRIQELRKHQLDLHLNFIVDQTEQYSDWLVQSMKTSTTENEDEEFRVTDEMNDEDNEETIEEEEQLEPDEYEQNEIQELAADQEESIDVLLKRYYGIELSNSSSEKENNIPSKDVKKVEKDKEEIQEIKQMTTTAQSLQPTGFTLNTTEVKTAIPFILKHSLREYQHVGLHWLVTLYENKLNCILADEMGLGSLVFLSIS